MPSGDIFECSLTSVFSGESAVNVYHVKQLTGDPAIKAQELAIKDAYLAGPIPAAWAARSTSSVLLQFFRVYRIKPTRGFPTTFITVGIVGLVGGDTLPSNHSVLHRVYSEENNATGRGFHYWMGVPATLTQDGQIQSAQEVAEIALGAAFKVDITNDGATWQWGVYSRANETISPIFRTDVRGDIRMHRNRTSQVA